MMTVAFRYTLLIDRKSESPTKSTDILELLHGANVKDSQVVSDIGSELMLRLGRAEVEHFPAALERLEQGAGALGISSFGISITSLEEVYYIVQTCLWCFTIANARFQVFLRVIMDSGGGRSVEDNQEPNTELGKG